MYYTGCSVYLVNVITIIFLALFESSLLTFTSIHMGLNVFWDLYEYDSNNKIVPNVDFTLVYIIIRCVFLWLKIDLIW